MTVLGRVGRAPAVALWVDPKVHAAEVARFRSKIVAGPGSYIFLPRGVPHGFRVSCANGSKVLIHVIPGGKVGFVGMMLEMATPIQDRHKLPAAMPPDIKQLVREKLDSVFTTASNPRHVQVSPPRRDLHGLGWTACVKADLRSVNGKPLGEDASATLAAGGKRLRPLLVLLCAGASGGEAAVRAAAAVELVHMATLVHDDILDNAPLRRGQPTVAATSGHAESSKPSNSACGSTS